MNCPDCHGPVESAIACHTYPQTTGDKTTWMACMPCDSATRWYCVAAQPEDIEQDEWFDPEEDIGSGCGWRFTDRLNPRNPRYASNEMGRPEWLEK